MLKRKSKVADINAIAISDFEAQYVPAGLLTYSTSKKETDSAYTINFKSIPPPKSAALTPAATTITDAELESCFDLITRTSASDYETSAQGWKPAAKRAEMQEQDMRYLLVRSQAPTPKEEASRFLNAGEDGWETEPANKEPPNNSASSLPKDDSILGFMSFMVTIEEGQDVIYVYEIHLEDMLRGCGLGRRLFAIAEHVGVATAMEKVMLTVFRRNQGARAMYKTLGYETDESSPRARRLRGGVVKQADYIILSKRLRGANNVIDEESKHRRENKRRKVTS